MKDYKLAPVGIDAVVSLEGDVRLRAGRQPVIILLAERHDNNDGIGQNLLSALNVIKAGVVRLVAVEKFTPIDIKGQMSQEPVIRKAGSIAAFGQSIREENGGNDEGVIAAIRARPNSAPICFARYLILLSPDTPVVGVEDPNLHAEAQASSVKIGQLFEDEPDAEERVNKGIEKFRSDGAERELARDAAFLRNLRQEYDNLNAGGAILINAGGRHMERIAARLEAEGKAHILIVPDGYTDALASSRGPTMRLFHCSNEKYTTLTPQFGTHRHGSEGAGASDKAVIWLSNDGESVAREGGQIMRFRHEVEVQDNDPNLVLDEKLEEARLWTERTYGKPNRLRWYTYSKPLDVISVTEYDEERDEYVPV